MKLDSFTYLSFKSIKENLLLPLNKFPSNNEIIKICKSMVFHSKFFPMPFFLAANEQDLKEIKNNEISIYYKNKFLEKIKIQSVSFFSKEVVTDLLFSKKNKILKHPFKDYINKSGNFIIETRQFNLPFKKQNKNHYIGFATRNVPHKGHEKILKYYSNKKKVLVNIFEDTSNNKKINSSKTLKAYNIFIKKNNLKNKIFIKKLKFPSFLLGPRQAAIHALIGKNLSCKSYIIGRDHSGYKKFYKTFDSINFCKKMQNKIGIKILDSGSPVFCLKTKKILFRNECNSKNFIDISASLIRKAKNKKFIKLLTNFY